MRIKRHILAFVAIIILIFGLPVASSASQPFTGSGIRIIELSAAGNDIANSVAFSPDGKWLVNSALPENVPHTKKIFHAQVPAYIFLVPVHLIITGVGL